VQAGWVGGMLQSGSLSDHIRVTALVVPLAALACRRDTGRA